MNWHESGKGLAPAKSAETITYMRTILRRKLTARVYTFVETADWSAAWTDGVYAYSVTFESGAAEDTAEDVIMAVY